jgi:cytochrome P450
MNVSPAIAEIDISSAAFKANPFPYFAELREIAPVYLLPAYRGQKAWLVTRYDDIEMVLRSDDFAKDPKNAMTPEQLKKVAWIPPIFKPLTRNLLFLDVPDHTRLRALVHKVFTPRMVEQMRAQTETLSYELLDKIKVKGGTIDLIAEYGLPLPARVIGRILGVPERDTRKFQRWTQSLVTMETSGSMLVKMVEVFQFMGYLRKLIKQRARDPQDDLISAMLLAKENDDHLTEDEILAMTFLLLNAGNETTVNLIASGTLALLEHPDQWKLIQNNPPLIKTGIEELLRFVSPADMATERYARQDITIAGTTIPRGELVLAVIASANRDAAYFDNPDTVDVTRQDNKHLAFGKGIHYCIGAPLARLEGQIAFNTLIERMPNLRLAVPSNQLRWHSSFLARGLTTLPVSF